MRNTIFAFLMLFSVAGISACDDTTTPIKLPDLAMKAMPDLKVVMTGCNGLDNCLGGCAQGDTTCENDCFNNATNNGASLWLQAWFVCPATAYCGPNKGDGGATYCDSTDLDPTSTTALSQTCTDCLKASKLTTAKIKAACPADTAACAADLP